MDTRSALPVNTLLDGCYRIVRAVGSGGFGITYEAEDVSQDAFLRAWRYGASYDPRRGSATAWLLRITRNAALDYVRTSQRRVDHVVADADSAIDDMAGDADVSSPIGDLAAIADGLRSLPSEQRQTLMAAAYYGLTAREISDAWDIPLGTVKWRVAEARRIVSATLVSSGGTR